MKCARPRDGVDHVEAHLARSPGSGLFEDRVEEVRADPQPTGVRRDGDGIHEPLTGGNATLEKSQERYPPEGTDPAMNGSQIAE